MPRAQRDEQMLCVKMYSLPKVKVSRLYTAVSRCGICLLQWIFQKETTKPLENQVFFVCISWVWAGFGGKVFNFAVFTFWMHTCGICLLQCIFQRGTTKPLEMQMFFVYSFGLSWIWRKSVQFCSFYLFGVYKRS